MNTVLYKNMIFEKLKQLTCRICILIYMLILPTILTAQIEFDSITPEDMQLIPRDIVSNKGEAKIKGKVTRSGEGGQYDYDYINIRVYRGNDYFYPDEEHTEIKDQDIALTYIGDVAIFDISEFITAEKYNYSFKIGFRKNSTLDQALTIFDVVAGDVYAIYGQSNAEAFETDYSADADNKSIFIRSYGSMQRNDGLLTQMKWFEGSGDGPNYIGGVMGQWGLKLARKILDNQSIPVAIFNHARGATSIADLLKNAPQDAPITYNNYNRLFIRLNNSDVKDNVRAIFWSQGEADITQGNSTSDYISKFNQLKASWAIDFPNVDKIYLFQTKSGCSSTQVGAFPGIEIKEAQRQIAMNDNDVHIMQTTGLDYWGADSQNCHFAYTGGYEGFANRIYKLVDRDFYGNTGYNVDIETPMITDSDIYMKDLTTLVIQTNALSLSYDNPPTLGDFVLNNADEAFVTGLIIDNSGINSRIELTLDKNPGINPTLTYAGVGAGEDPLNLIKNSQLIEIVCFDGLTIDTSMNTIWNGSTWSHNEPVLTMNAIIDGNYTNTLDNLVANDLTVNSGNSLNFDNSTTSSIVVNGNLNIIGTMTIGDTESLVNYGSVSVSGSGSFIKNEKTTQLDNQYDVTYWSSSVRNASLATVFSGVDANRIFHYNPLAANSAYTGTYEKYRHWFVASGDMIPGKGYSVDGKTSMSYPGDMEVSFSGTPNYGNIQTIVSKYSTISGGYDRTNLLGNPYPTAINADALLLTNSSVIEGESLHVWTHGQTYSSGEYVISDYLTYNRLGANGSEIDDPYYIASGQGFMILTDQSSATFNFLSSMQVEGENDQFYKSEKAKKGDDENRNRVWLNMTRDDNLRKEMLIGFTDQATSGVDSGFDGILFNSDSPVTFYSLIKDKKFTIQGLHMDAMYESTLVNIGFSTTQTGTYKIGISKVQGALRDRELYLIDKELNITHDLSLGNYSFEQSLTGDFSDRFALQFMSTALDVEGFENENAFRIANITTGIKVISDKVIEELEIYDILGRKIYETKPNKQNIEINLERVKNGTIVIVRATLENGVVLSKKAIIKY